MSLRSFFIFFFACVGHFCVDFMWGVWPLFKTMRGIDLASAGLLTGMGAFIAEISQVFFGGWSDRGGRFLVIGLGILLAHTIPFIPLFSTFSGYFFVYLAFALGSAAFHPAAVGVVASLTRKPKAFLISIFWASGAIGLSLSQLTFTQVYNHFEGNTSVLAFMALPLIFFSAYLHLTTLKAPQNKKPFSFLEIFKFFKIEDTRLLWIFQFAVTAIFWGFMFYLPDLFRDKGCPHWVSNGTGHFFYVAGAAAASLPGGWLSDRFSPKVVMQVTVLISAIAYFAFLLTPELSPPLVLSLVMVIGAGLGLVTPICLAWGNTLIPESPALISAFLMGFVWFISELVGISGVGLLSRCFEEQAATRSLVVLGFLFVLAYGALYRLRPLSNSKQTLTHP